MPYPPHHRQSVRASIVRSAAALFNRHGYGAVSIDQVMAEVGLTRGGFYLHFRSKSDLCLEAMRHSLQSHPGSQRARAAPDPSHEGPRRMIDAYLGDSAAREPERACLLVTHAADAANGPEDVRRAYREMIEAAALALPAGDDEDRRYALAALCVGALTLSRGAGDPELAGRIRMAARRAAHGLIATA
jgi:TetR/AcrR family transcriptional regulator, transcriptional repressor for nem operon